MTCIEQPQLRVASYNIRAGLGTDLRRRPERVLETISGLQADIVALQEADFRMGARPSALPLDLIEETTGLRALPLGTAPSLGWHGNAILARPDLKLESVDLLQLPGLEPRGAVIADIGGAFGLRVGAVHLGLLRGSRRRQLDYLRNYLAALPTRPTLIMGDFNEWSRKAGLGRLASHYRIVTPQRTFPSRRPIGALDRIAHCGTLEVTPIEQSGQKGTQASDHLPIVAQISPVAP